ncbi:rab-GTPase-TBC domain-containing protein [Mycena sp. CBHHK59/15]|nr:rab-GTPase-TBC domain-containing protein [Mycena sp. CBHHK59/15]
MSSSTLVWVMDFESEKLTLQTSDDWSEYRSLSLSPGGFRNRRIEIWVLHAQAQLVPENSVDHESLTHRDERQIRLDTERSFVLYPVDSETEKDTLQSELHDLLVEIFRKRPKLNYFQGYHDIITVLLLTLPRELQLPCAEQLSLQRVRDSMGSTLEPVLGLLRVMKNLLRLADPQFAELLERTSPLPYYALPNLLTLFSHDMPTLPLIQHVFDYLLCRPPIFVVYLASAIILSRKQDVERLQEEGEEGMMHSLLSALPEMVDDDSATEAGTESPPLDPEGQAPMTRLSTSPEPSTHESESPSPEPRRKVVKRNPQSLTSILNMSDALHQAHPPSHPSLQLSSTMGPQSVIFTWSTNMSDMPGSDEAECMVEWVDLIVYPEPPVANNDKEKRTQKPRRKRFKRRVGTPTVGMIVGAGLVLGVAVAVSVYGARQNGDHTRDWRKIGRWVGGAFAGASERIMNYET